MTRKLSEKEQKEFLDWWADSALTVTIALNTQKTVKPSYILAYAAALDSPSVRELREAVKLLRGIVEHFDKYSSINDPEYKNDQMSTEVTKALAATAHFVKE